MAQRAAVLLPDERHKRRQGKRHLKRAIEGDVASAAAVLKLRAQAAGKQAAARQVVQFTDLLPIDGAQDGEGQAGESPALAGQETSDVGPTANDKT